LTILSTASATEVGNTRATNQDAVYAGERLCIVADGMGGHAGGEVAAQCAVSGLVEAFQSNASAKGLLAGTRKVNKEIFDRASEVEELHGMGTTLVAIALLPHRSGDRIALINVGDSRAYRLEGSELERLTEDHSLVEEMLRQEEITVEEAEVHPYRHVMTRAIGINERVEVDTWTIVPNPGTRFLLCSDGLTNECSDAVIEEILVANAEPADAAYALIRRALDHGGNDNITVIVADVVAGEQPLATVAGPGQSHLSRVKMSAASERRARHSRERSGQNLGEQLVTFRVALFSFVLTLVLAGALGFTIWFNKASYFIGIDHQYVAIYSGRPGGFLWFKPSLMTTTPLKASAVLPANLPLIEQGMLEPSYAVAQHIIKNLSSEQAAIAALNTSNASSSSNG